MVLSAGADGLAADAQRRAHRLQLPRQLQLLLDALPGAQVPGDLRRDAAQEAAARPERGGAARDHRLLHRWVTDPADGLTSGSVNRSRAAG